MTYSKAPTKGERERLSRKENKIRFIDLDFKQDKLWDLGKRGEDKIFHRSQVLRMNANLWDRVCGLGSQI